MKDRNNISRACRFYILKSKDTFINMLIFSVLGFFYIFALYKGVFDDRGERYVLLLMYVLILAMSIISSNSMVIDLTVKDKLNKRIDFLLASGINILDIIKSYSMEMWRISNIGPFIIFFSSYIIYDFKVDFKIIIGIYISILVLTYGQVLYFNILSMYRKNYKFFKNIMFFSTSILIYIVGTFAEKIINFTESVNINIYICILAINIFASILLLSLSLLKLNKMTNESVIRSDGKWS